MAFEDNIYKTLERGRGYKWGRAWSTRFEGENKDRFVLKHYDTDILVVDMVKKVILGWDGWSSSDRDALNSTRIVLGNRGYLKEKHSRGQFTFKPVSAPQGLWFWDKDGKLMGRAMKPIKVDVQKKKAKTRKKIIDRNIRMWKTRIETGELASGGGECWGISMGIQECETCDQFAKPSCGGGVRFLGKVLSAKGYRYPGMFLGDSKGPKTEVMLQNWDTISRALRAYYNKKL